MSHIYPNFDLIVEVISLLTVFLLTLFGLYAFHRTRERRHLALVFAFALLTLASAANVIFNFLVEFEVLTVPVRGYLAISPYHDVWRFFFHLFSLAGYLTIFLIAERLECPRKMLLIYLIAVLGAWTAHGLWPAYYALSVIILSMAVYHFHKVFLETGLRSARNIALGFAILLVSEVVTAFAFFGIYYYVAGQVLRLLAFLTLLYTIARIYFLTEKPPSPMMRTGKKKK